MVENVHWRKFFNPKYIGEWDFEPGEEMIVQVKDIRIESITNNQGHTEEKPVLYFENGVKPLILKKPIAEAITKALGSPLVGDWIGKKLQLYVTPVSAFGILTNAVRVREFAPK